LDCAADDVIKVAPDGRFVVERRGPNFCVQAGKGEPFTQGEFDALAAPVGRLGGLAEAPADLRFLVVTVPVATELTEVEATMASWADRAAVAERWFGNHNEPAGGSVA
jgi:hypothetical protein